MRPRRPNGEKGRTPKEEKGESPLQKALTKADRVCASPRSRGVPRERGETALFAVTDIDIAGVRFPSRYLLGRLLLPVAWVSVGKPWLHHRA